MRTVSSYGVEIRKQNIPARQTMEIYRQAVGYLTEIYAQVWEELREIPETKKRFNTAEHMVHMTKKNTARFDFDLRFPKMPSYLRRSAIQHALGSVSSYETRLGQWKETGVLSGRCRTDFADIQNKKECGGNRQWQNHYLRNWAANTKGKGII